MSRDLERDVAMLRDALVHAIRCGTSDMPAEYWVDIAREALRKTSAMAGKIEPIEDEL